LGRREDIARDYADGIPLADIRARHSYSNPTVVARAFGLPPRRRFFTPELVAAIVADYVAGEKLEVISMTHGCSLSYPSNAARDAGYPPRRSTNPHGRAGKGVLQ